MTQNLSAAIHESSHLICGVLNAAKVNFISCTGPSETNLEHEGILGVLKKDLVDLTHPHTRQATMVLLCGLAGARKFSSSSSLAGAEYDINLAKICLSLKGRPEVEKFDDERFYKEFGKDAKVFVDHPLRWKMILKFASELQRRRTMSGQEAVQFVETEASTWPAGDQIEFWYPQDGLGGDQLSWQEHKP